MRINWFLGWTLIDLGKQNLVTSVVPLSRQAGMDLNTNSNITDTDDSNWAFKVKFTLPDIRMRCYKCS